MSKDGHVKGEFALDEAEDEAVDEAEDEDEAESARTRSMALCAAFQRCLF